MKFDLRKRIREIHYGEAALVAFVVSFFYLIALPLQTYLGNAEMFDYSAMDLLGEAIVLYVGAFIILFIAEIVTEPIFGRLLMLAILLFGVLGYIQVSWLSMGLPPLNGHLGFLLEPTPMNYVGKRLFQLIFIVVLLAYKWLIPYAKWTAIGLLIMTVAFLFDGSGRLEKSEPVKTKFDSGYCSYYDMVKSLEFSTNRNVIVLIVDSAPADIIDQVINERPELKSEFPGFVAFKNNIGMHDCTARAMPALITGKYLEKDTDIDQNERNFWGSDSAINAYFDSGYDLFVCHYVGKSYTNRRKSFTRYSVPQAKYAFLRYTKIAPFVTLKDVLFYRLAFYRHKFRIITEAIRKGEKLAGVHDLSREWNLYPELKESIVTRRSSAGSFCLVHSEGLHIPIHKDSKGNDLSHPDESRKAIKEYAPYVMSFVGDFMKSLKQKGVYDNSMIVIAADHGILYDPKSTLLWIKPHNATGEFRSSDAPTSHCRIAELLKHSVTENLSQAQVENALQQEVRKLRISNFTPDKWWVKGPNVDVVDIYFNKAGEELRRTKLGPFLVN